MFSAQFIRPTYVQDALRACKKEQPRTAIFHFFDVSSAKDTSTGRTAELLNKGNDPTNILQVFLFESLVHYQRTSIVFFICGK